MLFVNLGGLLLIGLIVWWFWLYRPTETLVSRNELLITVENGTYSPSRIKLAANTPVTLRFIRKDASPCAETLLIPDLQISANLPLNKMVPLQLPPMQAGEYAFHCQMQMYRGQLHVE